MTITLTAWPIRFLEGSAFSETGTALRRVNHVLRFGGGGVANEEAHRQTTNTGVFLRYVQFSPSPPNRCMGASTLYSLAHWNSSRLWRPGCHQLQLAALELIDRQNGQLLGRARGCGGDAI